MAGGLRSPRHGAVHDGIHTLSYIDSYDTDEYYDEASDEYKTRKQAEPRFFRFDIGGNSGVIDANGKVIIPAIYYNVYIVNDRLFQVEVTSSGERILLDTQGRYVGKKYQQYLRNGVICHNLFIEKTNTRKAVRIVLVSTYGLVDNPYAGNVLRQ